MMAVANEILSIGLTTQERGQETFPREGQRCALFSRGKTSKIIVIHSEELQFLPALISY